MMIKMKKELDFDKLEDVKVTFGKEAFAPRVMYCDKCDIKMKGAEIEINISENVKVKLNAFRCHKCKEEALSLEEAKKLDKALIVSRLLSEDFSFSFKRRLSFDGNNYIFRLPNELTKGKHTEVRIVPLESNEALIMW